MINGVVSASIEATIQLPVQAKDGWAQQIEAVLDPGFSGALTLPTALIAALGLQWRGLESVTLANGATEQCDVYVATVVWDGMPRDILVEAAEVTPLVGMALLHGNRVCVEVTPGGSVVIETLPP
jgi:predicted aspartyl protease